jgi:hypothetical protein
MFEDRVLREYLGLEETKKQEVGENYISRTSMI